MRRCVVLVSAKEIVIVVLPCEHDHGLDEGFYRVRELIVYVKKNREAETEASDDPYADEENLKGKVCVNNEVNDQYQFDST